MNDASGGTPTVTSTTDSQHTIESRDGMIIEWDAPIEMDDGLVLRANIYRPDGDGRFPVIMSHGPYGKDLAWQEGYQTTWEIFSAAHPEAIEGSSNVHQSWEVVDPSNGFPMAISASASTAAVPAGRPASSIAAVRAKPGISPRASSGPASNPGRTARSA